MICGHEFKINVYDEDIIINDVEMGLSLPKYLRDSLTNDQKDLADSRFLRSRAKAAERVNAERDEVVEEIFKRFEKGSRHGNLFENVRGAFVPEKYWHLLQLLDGQGLEPTYKRLEDATGFAMDRKIYQLLLAEDVFFGEEGHEILQKGFDIAVNSALLHDLMPAYNEMGSTSLLTDVILDKESLLYPSVTPHFQRRIINEAFWELIGGYKIDSNIGGGAENRDLLDTILAQHSDSLDPTFANDQLLLRKINHPHRKEVCPLVYTDKDFSYGLSTRAINNYGEFIDKTLNLVGRNQLSPFINQYVEAVTSVQDDGIDVIPRETQERMLNYKWAEYALKEKVSGSTPK